jgi:hypothetical protein
MLSYVVVLQVLTLSVIGLGLFDLIHIPFKILAPSWLPHVAGESFDTLGVFLTWVVTSPLLAFSTAYTSLKLCNE